MRDNSLLAVHSVSYLTMIVAIADLFKVAYVGFSPLMASHPPADVHFRNAVEHLLPVLHPLLISYMCLVLLESAIKQLLVHLYHLVGQLFQLVYCLDLQLHDLLEAIS